MNCYILDAPAVVEKLQTCDNRARVIIVLVDTHGVVHASCDNFLLREPLDRLQARNPPAIVRCL